MRRRSLQAVAGGAISALVIAAVPSATATAHRPPAGTGKDQGSAVTGKAIQRHLQKFQAIADANGGNRATATPGYEASARYVEKTLRKAGYEPQRQYFDVETFNVSDLRVEVPGVPLAPVAMSYSTSTDDDGVQAPLVAPTTATGCDEAAWSGVDATARIAVVSRGVCTFGQKALAAGAAGADALIIYNNEAGPLNGTLGEVNDAYAPVVGVTQAEGEALLAALAAGEVTGSFDLQADIRTEQTFNVIAETKGGSADNVVMLGSHLDSVADGPGINDNASGSAAILETAVQLAKDGANKATPTKGKPGASKPGASKPGKKVAKGKTVLPHVGKATKHHADKGHQAGKGSPKKLKPKNGIKNKVRFAWWGAEELGLHGSTHYVDDLKATSPADLEKIAVYLNFDMVGSTNYIIGVYDADESTYEAPVEVPEGSVAAEKAFTDYFDAIGQPWVDTEFSGRSDYQAFIENGVPASGLFTGADGSKTEEEVALFGGTAGIAYDPNYHTPQDDISNVDPKALDVNGRAIGAVVRDLARSTEAINGR